MSAVDTRSLSSVALDAAAEQGRAALVGYLPVGYPDVAGSVDAVKAMVDGGVDVVELGPDAVIVVNLSGRGDKDVDTAAKWFGL